jgi:uncharacterized protein (TIGR03083 family)
MTVDLGELYRNARLRIGDLVSDDVGTIPVAATPLWNVHDVVAHLAGIAEDRVNGNMAGAPGSEWTAAQVERGRSKSVSELVAGWAESARPLEELLSTPAGLAAARSVLDIHTHESDLRTALGLPLQLPDGFVEWMSPLMVEGFHEAVSAAGLAPVEVDASTSEFFRGRLGRRTEVEVRGYAWSADPTPYLDTWFIFGRAEHSLGEA